MPTKAHFHAALDLFEVTQDPMLSDAIRVFSTKNSPKNVVGAAEKYVESQYAHYLNLFRNSDTHQLHDYFKSADPTSIDE